MTIVREEILAIIAREAHVAPEKVRPEATLKDLEISSLEVLEIVFAIEEHFSITLPDRDPGFETPSVGALIDALERLVMDKQQTAAPVPV